jgi:hypothetical protein
METQVSYGISTTLNRKSIISMLSSAAMLLVMAAASPAMAMDNGTSGTAKSKGDLEGEGWTCVVVATGFWSCTKPGEKEQWCDTTSCGPAPKTGTKPKTLIHKVPNAGIKVN